MNIVQLTDQYAPSIGGTERHVARLASTLTLRGHHVTVVTVARPGLAARETVDGVDVVRIDSPELSGLRRFYRSQDHSFHPPVPTPGTARALAEAVNACAPDVVHGHNWLTYPYLTVKARVGVPVVHTLHDYGAVCPKMTLLRPDNTVCTSQTVKDCLRCAPSQYSGPVAAALTFGLRAGQRFHDRIDRVLAVSEPVAAAQQAVFDTPIEVVPTFVADNLATIGSDLPRPMFLPDGPFILFVGALSEHKGVGVLLDAHAQLGPTAPPLVLLGVRKPGRLHLDRPGVVVVENVPHPEVMAAWRHATVGVVPSLWAEPWGQVAAEALTAGSPLVVSDTLGLAPQIRDAHAGLLVRPNDPAGLAAAIRQMLDDRPFADRCVEAGRQLAASLTVSAVVGRLEEIFTEVTGSPAGRHPARGRRS